ncbi:MAG: hypothetical protein AAB455_03125 [Patescibacteria group bacterium]
MFKIKLGRRRPPKIYKPHSHPDRVWGWFISIFLILAAATLTLGYYAYRGLAESELVSQERLSAQSQSVLKLNEAELKNISEQLLKREEKTKTLKTAPPAITDPAI